jgi:hypothetical protein
MARKKVVRRPKRPAVGARVDRAIQHVMRSGLSKASAIAVLKSRGVIHQAGKHLAAGKARKRK